jgi:hypothetical protein
MVCWRPAGSMGGAACPQDALSCACSRLTCILGRLKCAGVPTVKIIGPYRLHFYSGDREEPRHVHVERDSAAAKFWLDPVRLDRSHGFPRAELARLLKLVESHQAEFRRKWNDYFGFE